MEERAFGVEGGTGSRPIIVLAGGTGGCRRINMVDYRKSQERRDRIYVVTQ